MTLIGSGRRIFPYVCELVFDHALGSGCGAARRAFSGRNRSLSQAAGRRGAREGGRYCSLTIPTSRLMPGANVLIRDERASGLARSKRFVRTIGNHSSR